MALLSTRSKLSITDDDVAADGDSCAAMKVLRLKPSGMATARPLPLLGLGKSTAQDPSPFLSSDGKISATSATMESTLHRNGKRTRTVTWSDEVTYEALEVNNDKRSKIAKVSSSNTVAFPTANDNSNNSSDEENVFTPSGRTILPIIKSALRNNNSMNKALLPAAAAVTTIGSSSSSMNTPKSEIIQSTGTKKRSKRQHWTESEDNQLRKVVSEFTQTNKGIEWVKIAEKMGGDRSGKQCRGKCTLILFCSLLILRVP